MQRILEAFIDTHKRPQLMKITKGRRVLVLAPHPDDEIIGPGGTIVKHIDAGNPVHIVFITDGSKGRSRGQTIEEIVEIRMLEAATVCEQLGATYSFLGCKDGDYIPEETKLQQLIDIMEEFQPTDVFIPHSHDTHRDHFMTNLLFFACIKENCNADRMVWEYEVWAPLQPNTVVNITKQFHRKQELLSFYESQLKLISYQEIMAGLNMYRVSSIPIRGITHMEAFYCSDEQRYVEKLTKQITNEQIEV